MDLTSLFARERIQHTNYKDSWCTPTLVIRNLTTPDGVSAGPPSPAASTLTESLKKYLRQRSVAVREGLVFNFDQMTWTPSAAIPLLFLCLATLAVCALDGAARFASDKTEWRGLRWIPRIAWTLLLLPLLINEVFIARFLGTTGTLDTSTVFAVRTLQIGLLLTGFALLVWHRQIGTLFRRLIVQSKEHSGDLSNLGRGLLVVTVVTPWLALMMVAEENRSVRYFWMWPLQVVLAVAAVTYLPKRLGWPRSVAWVGQLCLTAILLTHPWLVSPLKSWATSGWSGPTANNIQAVDYLANHLRSQGRTTAAIGYQTFFVGFMPAMNIVEPRYKVGGELDLYLRDRYGIFNSNRCAEGISPEDEYRIVQRPPRLGAPPIVPVSWAPMGPEVKTYDLVEYFDVPVSPEFRLLRDFGVFQVFQRIPAP